MERGWQRLRWLDSIPDSVDTNVGKFQAMAKGMLQFMGSQRVRRDLVTEQQLWCGIIMYHSNSKTSTSP